MDIVFEGRLAGRWGRGRRGEQGSGGAGLAAVQRAGRDVNPSRANHVIHLTAIIFWSNTYFVTTMYFIEEVSCVDIGVRGKVKVR